MPFFSPLCGFKFSFDWDQVKCKKNGTFSVAHLSYHYISKRLEKLMIYFNSMLSIFCRFVLCIDILLSPEEMKFLLHTGSPWFTSIYSSTVQNYNGI